MKEPAQTGDILLFYHATGFKGRVIAWFTRSEYYHAAIYSGNDHVIEARPGGIVDRDLSGPVGGHEFVVIPAPEGKGEAALEWAKTQIGDKYDTFDVVIIVLEHIFKHWHINYTPKGKYSCGEFVAAAFQNAGVTLFPDRPLNGVVPADFARYVPENVKSEDQKQIAERTTS